VTVQAFAVALALYLLSMFARTPTAWVTVTEGDFVLVCGDDDGAEVPCDIEPSDTESCE
jgi:hypothetical protein